MRKFSSYGPVNTRLHYYVPRQALVDQALTQMLGENPDEGGHYITVWAPRQAGKTWIMQQALFRLRNNPKFDVLKINLEHLKMTKEVDTIVRAIAQEIIRDLGLKQITVKTLKEFYNLFTQKVLKKPLILIMDEFDALAEDAISGIAGVFRNIYIHRQDDFDKSTGEKGYLLHGAALIGVRSVLGIENVTGSPFNVQRSLPIPNLTFEEVDEMFKWYERESGQMVEQAVIDRLFYETNGQPGLTCWFGELLTETYNKNVPAITMRDFEIAYAATDALPNSNILNIIGKAKQEPYKQLVLEMFKTDRKIPFKYDDTRINFLYMNGILDQEIVDETKRYLKFPCPFIQKRLFNYFAYTLFRDMGKLHEPFEELEDTITEDSLNIKNLMRRYEQYLKKNRKWLLKDAPRRADLRIFEAVYHFNLYKYLADFLQNRNGTVYPEFPAGNGQIDLIIKYGSKRYGLEVKSYTDQPGYRKAIEQAAHYGKKLQLTEISLIFFVEYIGDDHRKKFEAVTIDTETGVTVSSIFVETGR